MQSYTSVELTIIQLDSTAYLSARSCRWPVRHSGQICNQECWTSTPTSDYDHPNLKPVCESVRHQGRLGQGTDKHIQALIAELYSYPVNMSHVS